MFTRSFCVHISKCAKRPSGVNFINIKCARFSYECRFGSISLVTCIVTFWFGKKFVRKMHVYNVDEIDTWSSVCFCALSDLRAKKLFTFQLYHLNSCLYVKLKPGFVLIALMQPAGCKNCQKLGFIRCWKCSFRNDTKNIAEILLIL